MKIDNLICAGISAGFYFWSLIIIQDVLISIVFGILTVILLFLDELTYKPINLIGWEIKKEQEKE